MTKIKKKSWIRSWLSNTPLPAPISSPPAALQKKTDNNWCFFAATLLICFCTLSNCAIAGALQQWLAFQKNAHSASGSFEQNTQSKSAKSDSSTSKGIFAFQRPNRFRWEYQQPYALLIVGDGEKVWTYDTDLQQVTIHPFTDASSASPAGLLVGKKLSQNFTLQDTGKNEGLEILTAKPKSLDTAYAIIRIGMKDDLPRYIEITDNFGQITILRFTRFDVNAHTSAEQFHFTIPAGADVVGE